MRILPVSTRTCAIALIAAAAIGLTACGGGGLSSDDEAALQDDLKAAVAQAEADAAARAAAEAAQAAAEAAQAAAEMAQAEAEAAQAAAETQAAADRAAKETAEAQAEADRAAKVAAEAQAESALAAQRTAEAEAEAARTAQRTAEAEATAARAAQTAAEAAQAAAEARATAAETNSAEANRLAEQARMDKEAADRAAMEAEAARDAALAEQRTAEAARDAAEAAQATAEAAQRTAETAQAAAETARMAAETAKGVAERERDQARAAQREAERLRRQAEQNAQTKEEQRQAAEAEKERLEREAEQARQEAERRIEEAERQANVAVRAPLLITELSSVAATDNAAGVGVRHMPGESRTFTRPSDLPAKGSAPSVPGSWSSASYSGPRGNIGTDTVYLYTNIQAPSSKAFWKEHGERVEDSEIQTLPAGVIAPTVRGFGMPEKTLLTEVSTGKITESGTYDGYSGTFTCESGCNIATTAGTEDLTFTGTWTFTASLTAKRRSQQAEQDTEFLYFGIWAFEPTDAADTTNPHDFKWAAGGDAVGDITNFDALTGTATFTGGAIGKYALKKVGGRAAKIGTFTATANFTANFDQAPDGSAGNRISGRITDFKEGGSDLGSDWHVFLGATASTAATLTASGVSAVTTGLAGHGAIDGDSTTGGAWAATLHGSDNNNTLDRDKYPASRYPVADIAGVAGWFTAAAGSDAAIAGAFGAACTTGTMCAK